MAGNSKPRKTYKGKPCVKALGMRDNTRMEIPGYQASIALGTDYMSEPHLYDLVAHADMVQRIAKDGETLGRAETIMAACKRVMDRASATGKFGVSGDDLVAIRGNIGATMEFLRSVPNVAIWRAAKAAVDEFDRLGGVRLNRRATA